MRGLDRPKALPKYIHDQTAPWRFDWKCFGFGCSLLQPVRTKRSCAERAIGFIFPMRIISQLGPPKHTGLTLDDPHVIQEKIDSVSRGRMVPSNLAILRIGRNIQIHAGGTKQIRVSPSVRTEKPSANLSCNGGARPLVSSAVR